MAQRFCKFLFKVISILFPIQPHCLQGDSMEAATNTVEPVKKDGPRRLHHVASGSKVLNWTAKSVIPQCSALCIPLVNSWPLAKLQLNVTEQRLYLIKCLTLDLQLFCTAHQLCCTSAGCVLNYSNDIHMC